MATNYLFEVPLFTKNCDIDWTTLKMLPINSFVKKQIIDETGIFEVCFTKLKDTLNSRGFPSISIDVYNPYKNFDYIITFKGNRNQSINRPISFPLAEKILTEYFSNGILRIEVVLFLYEKLDPALRKKTRAHVYKSYGWFDPRQYWEKTTRFPYSMVVYSNETISTTAPRTQQNHAPPNNTNPILSQDPPPAYSDLPDAKLDEEKL